MFHHPSFLFLYSARPGNYYGRSSNGVGAAADANVAVADGSISMIHSRDLLVYEEQLSNSVSIDIDTTSSSNTTTTHHHRNPS